MDIWGVLGILVIAYVSWRVAGRTAEWLANRHDSLFYNKPSIWHKVAWTVLYFILFAFVLGAMFEFR